MPEKEMCLKQIREIMNNARKTRSAVIDSEKSQEELHQLYEVLCRINGDMFEAFHFIK